MATYANTVAEYFWLSTNLNVPKANQIIESIGCDSSESSEFAKSIEDLISQIDSETSSGSFSTSLLENAILNDNIKILFDILIANDITASSDPGDVANFINILIEYAKLISVGGFGSNYKIEVASALMMYDVIIDADVIEDSLQLQDALISAFFMANELIDALEAAEAHTSYFSYLEISRDEFTTTSSLTLSQSLLQAISEDIYFVTEGKGGNTFTGFAFNPINSAVTQYNNYSFYGSAEFDGDWWLVNEDGLFKVDGKLDESSFIHSTIKTATLSFGTSNFKDVREVLLGINNDSEVIIGVSIDDWGTVYYSMKNKTHGLSTQRIKLGRGLYGRFWQFELITRKNEDFDLTEFEIFPLNFGRKM